MQELYLKLVFLGNSVEQYGELLQMRDVQRIEQYWKSIGWKDMTTELALKVNGILILWRANVPVSFFLPDILDTGGATTTFPGVPEQEQNVS